MSKTLSDKEVNEERKESTLCNICRHNDYCIIRRYGAVYYCELFDFMEKKEKE